MLLELELALRMIEVVGLKLRVFGRGWYSVLLREQTSPRVLLRMTLWSLESLFLTLI